MNWVLHVHRTSRPCVMWIASSAVSVDADSLSIYLSSLDACPCGCARCGAPPQRVVMCSGGWLMLALGITQYTDRALSRGRSTVRAPWPVHGAVSGGHTYDVNRGVPSTVKNVRLSCLKRAPARQGHGTGHGPRTSRAARSGDRIIYGSSDAVWGSYVLTSRTYRHSSLSEMC